MKIIILIAFNLFIVFLSEASFAACHATCHRDPQTYPRLTRCNTSQQYALPKCERTCGPLTSVTCQCNDPGVDWNNCMDRNKYCSSFGNIGGNDLDDDP